MSTETTLEKLNSFKKWMHNDFKQYCTGTYGHAVFNLYISQYYEDMLECLEFHLEDLEEESFHDEEYVRVRNPIPY